MLPTTFYMAGNNNFLASFFITHYIDLDPYYHFCLSAHTSHAVRVKNVSPTFAEFLNFSSQRQNEND